jgi:cation diffusion facilitator CzcD-associated flavoprotein CzcO
VNEGNELTIPGICIAIDLLRKSKGTKFLIIERGNQIGGTWNDNQYPG